jgi:LysR family glycine cleavage system transcriptional activator
MAIPRRFLPSMSLLVAFEAAARSESFTDAAAELNLTPSAVSRQIRALEQILRYDLFYRERQTVRLTIAGRAYARDIRDVLRRSTWRPCRPSRRAGWRPGCRTSSPSIPACRYT